jgi:two-component system response regulator NreC
MLPLPLPRPSATRVALVDDDQLVVEGIAAVLRRDSTIEVLWSPSGTRLSQTIRTLRPQVLVMSLSLRRWRTADALSRAVRALSEEVALVIFTRHGEDAWVQRLFDAGASAYVLKQSPAEELLGAIRAAAAGQRYLDRALRERLTQTFLLQHSPARRDTPRLSDREDVVLRELAWGHSNKDIAARLDLSVKTVEVHRSNGMHKLGLHHRRDLMQHALRAQWLLED